MSITETYNNLNRIPTSQQERLDDIRCPECNNELEIDNDEEFYFLYLHEIKAKSASTGEEVIIKEYKSHPNFAGQRPSKVQIPMCCDNAEEHEDEDYNYFTLEADLKNIKIIK